ncbi:aromatic acid exporter family protein [Microbacterium sp. SS28]|uniref:FUSC family protein n=1 Tax=Microbacterium sp. SS28 TaxID=2919948 RepID=UPI001FAA38CD|nr:FUSC family protein [Microbacterium sp. SS28]
MTQAVPTGWRRRIDPRPAFARVSASGIPILQIVVAATAAYAFAHGVLGHPSPLLAATVTVGSLGLVRDARPRGVLETVLGMLVGIVVAELLLLVAGTGWWQIGLALGVTLVVARFLSPQAGFAIAAAIQSLIVMAIPSPAPFLRVYDGIIGGIAALIVTAFIPRNPLKTELRDARALFAALDAAAATLAQALRRGDRLRAERGLEKARALTPLADHWRSSLESGIAIARISPFLRRQRAELQRHERVRASLDLAVRNLRVIARRVVYVCDDGRARPVPAELLAEVMRAASVVSDSLEDIALQPAAREALYAVARRLDPADVLPDASLGDQNLVAALRPLVVDLLTATGLTPAEARAAIPRI